MLTRLMNKIEDNVFAQDTLNVTFLIRESLSRQIDSHSVVAFNYLFLKHCTSARSILAIKQLSWSCEFKLS